jgi:hypothetical protein
METQERTGKPKRPTRKHMKNEERPRAAANGRERLMDDGRLPMEDG